MYDQLFLLNFDDMIFLTCIVVIHYLIIDTSTWINISIFLKINEFV